MVDNTIIQTAIDIQSRIKLQEILTVKGGNLNIETTELITANSIYYVIIGVNTDKTLSDNRTGWYGYSHRIWKY